MAVTVHDLPEHDWGGRWCKDRVVPFPAAFKETLALHIDAQHRAGAVFLFESS
jgi:integrase/recombinase XerD